VLALVVLGCTSEQIQYVTRPPFNPPPDSISGFLGYYTVSTKQTTCGNCHIDYQETWASSKHASAHSDLIASGAATSSCFSCHDLTSHGNQAVAPAGYDKVADSVYQDVQCESCHGPGVTHVSNPEITNVPLARVAVDTTNYGCGGCHTGNHEPFVEEWSQSLHSQLVAPAISNTACTSCHEGKAALASWGVYAVYTHADSTTALPQTCTVCHDPMGSPNTAQLRFPINSPDENVNLCTHCHARTAEPVIGNTATTAHGGPHAPQGPMLDGTAGYFPPGTTYDTTLLTTSHGSSANQNLCAGCHVYPFSVTDQATGAFVLSVVGHSFYPTPCLATNGTPSGTNTCARPGDAAFTPTTRSFGSCAASGCHASQAAAQSAFQSNRANIAALVNTLWIDGNGNETLDPYPTDSGYLAQIYANTPADLTNASAVTPAEGCLFDVQMLGENLAANGDRSYGVHNPFLAAALLQACISELQTQYPYLAPPPPPVQAIMQGPLAGLRAVSVRGATEGSGSH
jgi:predicted CXXCH cytochrome family protein